MSLKQKTFAAEFDSSIIYMLSISFYGKSIHSNCASKRIPNDDSDEKLFF